MTTHKTCGRRRLTVLLCVLLLFCTVLAPPAFAAGVTVSTTSATAYFQTYASSGTWVDIGTPQHVINETGKVAYCLQTSLNSPSNSGYNIAFLSPQLQDISDGLWKTTAATRRRTRRSFPT